MSWNKCLYAYHQTHGGQLLAGEARDGLLVFTWKDQPLIVDLSNADTGKSFTVNFVRARIPVTLARPYTLTIGSEKATSGDGNWYLGEFDGIDCACYDAQMAQRIAESFFPRMDRFLGLCKAAYSAVTQWRM